MRTTFSPKSGVEKIIVNMVNSYHVMWDTWLRLPVHGKLNQKMSVGQSQSPGLELRLSQEALLTANVEAKLRRLTTIDYNHHNWSWLLDPNRPPELPVTPKMPASVRSNLSLSLRNLLGRESS